MRRFRIILTLLDELLERALLLAWRVVRASLATRYRRLAWLAALPFLVLIATAPEPSGPNPSDLPLLAASPSEPPAPFLGVDLRGLEFDWELHSRVRDGGDENADRAELLARYDAMLAPWQYKVDDLRERVDALHRAGLSASGRATLRLPARPRPDNALVSAARQLAVRLAERGEVDRSLDVAIWLVQLSALMGGRVEGEEPVGRFHTLAMQRTMALRLATGPGVMERASRSHLRRLESVIDACAPGRFEMQDLVRDDHAFGLQQGGRILKEDVGKPVEIPCELFRPMRVPVDSGERGAWVDAFEREQEATTRALLAAMDSGFGMAVAVGRVKSLYHSAMRGRVSLLEGLKNEALCAVSSRERARFFAGEYGRSRLQSYRWWYQSFVRMYQQHRTVRARIKIELDRRERGAYAQTLDAAGVSKSLQIDVTGGALVYRPDGAECTLAPADSPVMTWGDVKTQ